MVLLLLALGCGNHNTKNSADATKEASVKPTYLIEVADLTTMVNDPAIKIIDFRKPEQYAKGHLEGAVNIWRNHIEDQSYAYGGMMAAPKQIEALFSSLGIDNTHTLVVYDDNALCDAARLWWVLQNYDVTNVKMLNGGFSAWVSAGGQLTTDAPELVTTQFELPDAPSMRLLATKEQIATSLQNNQNITLIDTRTHDEFSGKRKKKGAAKAGRIPSSVLKDWTLAVNYDGDKKFKPVDALNAIYDSLGPKNEPVIVYCHSGVRSAHTTFVLTQLLGFENVKNYDGSWTEWSHFEKLPFVSDSITIVNN